MAFFTVIKSGVHLQGILLGYPYLIASVLFVVTLPALVARGRRHDFSALEGVALLLAGSLAVTFFYHAVVLDGDILDVLYDMRFYYGMFVLFYGFTAVLFWLDLGSQTVRGWIVGVTKAVISLSFFLAAVEFVGNVSGLADPESFWWIRRDHIPDILRYRMEGIPEVRAYGLASNSAVLGGFSIFLSTYYYSMICRGRMRLRHVMVLLMGVIPVFLSKSGTGLFLLVLVLIMVAVQRSPSSDWKRRGVLFIVLLVVAGLVVYFQTQPDRRLSGEYWGRVAELFWGTLGFVWDRVSSGWLAPLLGSMNLYQLSKPGAEALTWTGGEVTYFDFTYMSFLIEFGLIGIAVYLYSFWRMVRSSCSADPFIYRLAFGVLLLGSLHYAVSFWVCSQVMAAVILAAGMYIRSKETLSR